MRGFFASLLLLFFFVSGESQTPSPQEEFNSYWNAGSETERSDAIKKILDLNIPFDEVFAKLKAGRVYSPEVKKGFFSWNRFTPNGVQLYTLIFVPYNYTPDRKYPVRIFLNGGISSMNPYNVHEFIDTTLRDYKSVEQIRIYPSGYYAARWYYDLQYRNVMFLLDSIKKIYNIDENRVSLSGVSDGGTGTYAFANFDATPYCCFMPFIGSPAGLKFFGQHQGYFLNYSNKPFFIENGWKDATFPPGVVQPFVDQIMRLNHEVSYFMLDTFAHTMNWYPLFKDSIDHFLLNHPRNPYPDHLIWQTESSWRYNRNHWLVVTSLGESKYNAAELQDENLVLINGVMQTAFRRDSSFGIIAGKQEGNTIRIRTNGIKEYLLLLSPEQFNFTEPLTVFTNDHLSFQGRLEKNAETLLKWNSKDQDRAMLFAAELNVKVDKEFKPKKDK